ncbi:carbohydrate-binding domain-containing protein [Paenarthrobacter nitroguajacolicus]|uniref:Carbohydrate-binding domain-containing protein n=1 Tax=Paenarthrobacter nitroguajacolicus TaxID=211146 RepID=A0A558GPF5_PAENT|nr:carbohydrate-binding domain-containing protein [Paenarthrobacter nitroguajacolicus]TVU58741.1 carbohydrate-binding domain-containing protein [Paenarthrobacter nitroguajacolicus]
MRSFRTALSVSAVALAISLAGCSTAATSSTSTGATGTSTTTTQQAVTTATIEDDTHYDSDDLSWDTAAEVAISLSDGGSRVTSSSSTGVAVDGNTVTISAAGTYRLSGSLSDGQIVVAAGDSDTVRIVLDGVELGNSTGSPFVVQGADEAIVYLEDGSTNTLTDATAYSDQGEDAPNSALYSMADLTIAGTGSLAVNGKFNDGIVSKDGLVLASGKVTVDAVDDGIRGKDYTVLLDGAYQVTAGGDGVKADNETDEGRGWLMVSGGALTVNAGDDGVKAFNTLTVTGGTVTVAESEEGLEAQHIVISGGDVAVTSNDDGVNASGGSSTSTDTGAGMGGGMGGAGMGGGETVGDYTVEVSDGTLTIDAQGDGLDSNGNATISGGTVVVNGPTNDGNGALDVNGELTVTGGTVAAAGSAGMAVTPGTSSTQSGVQLTFDSSVAAGTPVHIVDSSGAVVATFVTTKTIASLVFSSSAITDGATYTVYTGGSSEAKAGVTTGSIDGAEEQGTVTAGQYTQAQGPGRR